MKPAAAVAGLAALAAALCTGCATLGREFPASVVSTLEIGRTTRSEIRAALGEPFRRGYDSGRPTATYLYYRLGLFEEPVTKDLTLTYGEDGTVAAYQFHSNTDAAGAAGEDAAP